MPRSRSQFICSNLPEICDTRSGDYLLCKYCEITCSVNTVMQIPNCRATWPHDLDLESEWPKDKVKWRVTNFAMKDPLSWRSDPIPDLDPQDLGSRSRSAPDLSRSSWNYCHSPGWTVFKLIRPTGKFTLTPRTHIKSVSLVRLMPQNSCYQTQQPPGRVGGSAKLLQSPKSARNSQRIKSVMVRACRHFP